MANSMGERKLYTLLGDWSEFGICC